jgi:hypothetical protein
LKSAPVFSRRFRHSKFLLGGAEEGGEELENLIFSDFIIKLIGFNKHKSMFLNEGKCE